MPSANRPSGPTHPTALARQRADEREQIHEALNPQAESVGSPRHASSRSSPAVRNESRSLASSAGSQSVSSSSSRSERASAGNGSSDRSQASNGSRGSAGSGSSSKGSREVTNAGKDRQTASGPDRDSR